MVEDIKNNKPSESKIAGHKPVESSRRIKGESSIMAESKDARGLTVKVGDFVHIAGFRQLHKIARIEGETIELNHPDNARLGVLKVKSENIYKPEVQVIISHEVLDNDIVCELNGEYYTTNKGRNIRNILIAFPDTDPESFLSEMKRIQEIEKRCMQS